MISTMKKITLSSPLLAAAAALALCLTAPDARAQSAQSAKPPETATPAFTLPVPDDIKPAGKPKSLKWAFSFLPIAFQRNPVLDFTVITEMTDEGRALPPPSFDKPVYFMSYSNGQHDQGDAYGGKNSVTFEQAQKLFLAALASAGYRPADATHPATQLLIFTWGAHNRVDISDGDGGDGSVSGDDSDGGDGGGGGSGKQGQYGVDSSNYSNIIVRARLVGGDRFAEELAQALTDQALAGRGNTPLNAFERFRTRDSLTSSLVDQVFDDCYYVAISSYDFHALAGPAHKKILLWRTKMSTAAQGVSLAQTIPGLLENGSWYFGRDMSGPEIVTKRIMRKATVEIGEATVQEYITGTADEPGKNPKQ